jgi:hypothetical protein
MAAAEAAAEESASRAEQDAADAVEMRRLGEAKARRIRALNAANHFTRWVFRDGAGGTA